MDVTINNQPLDTHAYPARTVGELLRAIRATEPDALIVAVALNGEPAAGPALDALLERPIDQPGRLELQLDSARMVAAEALAQARLLLAGSAPRYGEVATALAAGRRAAAMETLTDLLGGWDSVEQSLRQSCSLLGVDLSAVRVNDAPATERVDALRDLLEQIRQALARRDDVRVADLVEVELQGVSQQWQEMLAALHADLSAEP